MFFPYLTKYNALLRTTPSSIQEMYPQRFYDIPIQGHPVYRFDLMEALRPYVGDAPLYYRQLLYDILAGTEDSPKALLIAYHIFPDIRFSINDISMFGENTKTLYEQFTEECFNRINAYRKLLDANYDTLGIKVLPESHLYYYIAPRVSISPKERNWRLIC